MPSSLIVVPVVIGAALISVCSAGEGLWALSQPTQTSPDTCDEACRAAIGAQIDRSSRGAPSLVATVAVGGRTQLTRGGSTEPDAPAAPGGGGGQASACAWRPLGPIAEVAAAHAAVNAGQTPDVADPSSEGALIDAPGVIGIAGSSTDWYRVSGTSAQVYMEEVCSGVRTRLGWFDLLPDGAGGLTVQVTAEDLVPGVFAQVVRQLPTPVPHVGPADEDEHGYAYVNTPMIVWLDEAPGQWATVAATASAGGVAVTARADPVQLVVDPGDGAEALRCPTFRPVLRSDAVSGREFPPAGSCSYEYRDSSAMAPNGATWPLTVSIVWHVSWSANTGEAGDLGFVTTDSPVRDLPVAEIQAVITDSHSDG